MPQEKRAVMYGDLVKGNIFTTEKKKKKHTVSVIFYANSINVNHLKAGEHLYEKVEITEFY